MRNSLVGFLAAPLSSGDTFWHSGGVCLFWKVRRGGRNRHPCLASLDVPDDGLGSVFNGKYLSEYAQLFGLAGYLAAARERPRICFPRWEVCFPSPWSCQVSIKPYVDATNASEVIHLFHAHSELSVLARSGLVGAAIQVRSLVRQYVMHDHVGDICAFYSALSCVDGFDPPRIV